MVSAGSDLSTRPLEAWSPNEVDSLPAKSTCCAFCAVVIIATTIATPEEDMGNSACHRSKIICQYLCELHPLCCGVPFSCRSLLIDPREPIRESRAIGASRGLRLGGLEETLALQAGLEAIGKAVVCVEGRTRIELARKPVESKSSREIPPPCRYYGLPAQCDGADVR